MRKRPASRKGLFVALVAPASAVLTLALPAGAQRTATAARIVTVVAGKPSVFRFTVTPKTVPHGAVIFKFSVVPKAALPHDFKICSSPKGSLKSNTCAGKATKILQRGAKTTLSFTFKSKGTYEYLCTISGHAAAGMKGLLKVT